jgi:hypothetical protein
MSCRLVRKVLSTFYVLLLASVSSRPSLEEIALASIGQCNRRYSPQQAVPSPSHQYLRTHEGNSQGNDTRACLAPSHGNHRPLADDEGSFGTYRKPPEDGQAPSPTDVAWFSLRKDPLPVPDRPDVDGETWKEDLDLAHLTPHERKNVYQMLGKHRSVSDGRLGHAQT